MKYVHTLAQVRDNKYKWEQMHYNLVTHTHKHTHILTHTHTHAHTEAQKLVQTLNIVMLLNKI